MVSDVRGPSKMASTWNLFRKIGQKKVDEYKESYGKSFSDRIDRDLPLGLRFNCLVEFPEVDFILAGSDLLIKYPGSGCSVISFGKFPVGDSMAYRFYLSSSAGPYMLQLVADSNKVIEESKLFMPYDEIFPEDWGFWLADNDGYIGLSVFDTKNSTRFYRVWENAEATRVVEEDGQGGQIDRIPPVRFVEKIFTDPFGETTENVTHDSMLYGRHVNENVDEYLLISAIDEPEGASVQIMVGLELASTSIKVI